MVKSKNDGEPVELIILLCVPTWFYSAHVVIAEREKKGSPDLVDDGRKNHENSGRFEKIMISSLTFQEG